MEPFGSTSRSASFFCVSCPDLHFFRTKEEPERFFPLVSAAIFSAASRVWGKGERARAGGGKEGERGGAAIKNWRISCVSVALFRVVLDRTCEGIAALPGTHIMT